MKNHILLISAIIGLLNVSVAQDPSGSASSSELQTKSDSAPLPAIHELLNRIGQEAEITATAETEDSWWIGTGKGVYRIKKKNQKVIHYHSQNMSWPSNNVTSMCTSPDGQVYIGTDKGIIRYDRFSFLLINTENSRLNSDNVTALDYLADKGIAAETDGNNWYLIK